MRVFVTGGTGLVGRRLATLLLERGDEVVVLSRRESAARAVLGDRVKVVAGDPMTPGPWTEAVAGCDAVVNLVGENVFGQRWTTAFKQSLVDSRVKSTRNVAQALTAAPRRADGSPKIFVSASAIGIYGPRGDEEVPEDTPPGKGFLEDLCVAWEAEARAPESAGVRCAQVRVGVVLDREGGALAKLLTPFRMFVGGPVGSGRQYLAWIHHADLNGMFLFALDNASVTGPLNGTAPYPLTNKAFSTALGKALGRPSVFWTPTFVLRVALGEAASIVVAGQRVVPYRPLELGFQFRYPTVDLALAEIFP